MPIAMKAGVCHVKLQTALGSAVTITVGTDPALRIVGTPTREQIGEGQINRSDLTGSLGGPVNPRLGSLGWRFSFTTEFYGPEAVDDATTSPLWPLWAASAPITESGTSTGNLDWTPGLLPVPTASGDLDRDGSSEIGVLTFAFDEIGGNRYTAYDCTAAPTAIYADAGGRILIDWIVEGKWVAPAASTVTAGSEDYDPGSDFDLTPWLFCGATLSSGITGTPTGLTSFRYEPGVEHVTRMSAGSDGANCMAISQLDRRADGPTLAFSIDADDETSLQVWTEWLGGTTETRGITVTAPSSSSIDSCTFRMQGSAIIAAPEMGGDQYRTYDLVITGTTAGGNPPSLLRFTAS